MSEFLARPGSSGGFGALMDEYARAAKDFCRVVETFDPARFEESRESEDADCVSALEICRHVGRAALGYATDLNKACGASVPWPADPNERIRTPADVRPLLAEAVRFTESAVDPMRELEDRAVLELEFTVRWGAVYNPESMLEHAICHLLRHRRQLERW